MFKLSTVAAIGFVLALPAVASPRVIDCSGNWEATVRSLEPEPAGPLTLSAVRCVSMPHDGYPVSLSPDGSKLLSFHELEGLWVGGIDRADTGSAFAGRISGSTFPRRSAPFEWRSDSSVVMGVAQETNQRGFALTPLQPYLFTADGQKTRLPALIHPDGPLDEVFWMDGSGSAFATFGTRGSYYKPERTDVIPTIAMANAVTGEIMQSFHITEIEGLGDRRQWVAASRTKENGRIRALVAWPPDRWMLWDQNERPRLVPIEIETRRPTFTLSMDGSQVLIMGNLSATGLVCELGRKCPAPTPQSGLIAQLREVTSGTVIWSIDGTARGFTTSIMPAVSPQNRYALILLPDDRQYVALVSMADGRVLQRFLMPGWASLSFGFSPDGKQAWLTGGSTMAVFDIDDSSD